MIPILYDTNETAFVNNGIGRLRDCISCIVTEERNGIYECDFEYPITGANYELIQIGRIVGVTHDDTGDIQPFDIVSFQKPIDGIATFHCTHISYRQSYMTVTGTNINSLSAAFSLFSTATPSNPFNYQTDKTSTGYLGCADGIPRTVRQMLGGIEGSILDAYGGEYEFDKWNVILHNNRGTIRDFSIRYGVNMTEYNDEVDSQGAYSSCIPYWANGEEIIVASRTLSGGTTPTGRGECVPLDLTEKFENKPTTTQLKNAAKSYMNSNNSYLAGQTINVSFVRLQDMGEYADFQDLLTCRLCDTINVVFPDYGTNGNFKIVKTAWNVLRSRFDEMELGTLSTSLAEALGISESLDRTGNTFQSLSVLNNIYLQNNDTGLYGTQNDGTTQRILIGMSPANNVAVGYDSYSNADGNLNLYGNAVTLNSNTTITANQTITVGGNPMGLVAEEVLLADNITISGQTYGNGNASVSKTGYTPIGIVGIHLQNATTGGQNNTTCAMHSWYLSGTTAYWIVRGTSTATAKIKVTATVLYVKS